MSEVESEQPRDEKFGRALEWSWMNLLIGATSVGGAGRIQLYREALVEKNKWLPIEEFREAFSIAQLMPGPVFINCVVYLSLHLVGPLSVLISVILLGLPGAYFAVLLAKFVNLENAWVKWLFQGFAIGSVVVFGNFIWSVAKGLRSTHDLKINASREKFVIRVLMAIGVALASYGGFDLMTIVAVAGFSCLVVEFRL